MADPSTNVDPMRRDDEHQEHHDEDELPDMEKTEKQIQRKNKGRKKTKDVSKHTFFVSNSQMRLKLFAKNEVRFWSLFIPGGDPC